MESTPVTLNVSSFQLFLALAFQFWMIVFPIILIRKINYLTALIQDHFYPPEQQEQA